MNRIAAPRRSRALLLIATVAAVLVPMNAQALEMRGFRGLMWGDPPAHLGVAAVVSRQGAVACYQRERENLLFGDSALRAVRYCFHRDHLFMVELAPAFGAAGALRAEFERGYGPPTQSAGTAAQWGGSNTPVRAEMGTPPAGADTLRLIARDFTP